ncbi:MAG: hypothetical protein J6B87_06250 [Clostridia bacterium]|nr:hypothetical protein [Clostridia bacterium]
MAKIQTLKDYNNESIYPQTLTSAVYNSENQSLENLLALKANLENTYSKTEIDNMIAAIATLDIRVVDELPLTEISTKSLYFVRISSNEEDNVYEEYIYVNGVWEMLGTTAVDLSGYATKTELANYALKSSLQPIATQTTVTNVWVGTQSEYDALTTKESTRLYLIKG